MKTLKKIRLVCTLALSALVCSACSGQSEPASKSGSDTQQDNSSADTQAPAGSADTQTTDTQAPAGSADAQIPAGTQQPTQGGAAPVSYGTIIECCDWGPSVSKLVVAFDSELSDVSADSFKASVRRTYAGTDNIVQELDFQTFTMQDSKTAEGERTIENAYLSDENGGTTDKSSKYVTLEMAVGPEEGYGNAAGMEQESGLGMSVLLDCNYTITFTGESGETVCSTKDESLCQIPVVDKFTHDQVYTTETASILDDGLDNDTLHYASYEPQDDGTHPLLIWLHGAGEGGTDTRIPIMGNKACVFGDEAFQSIMGGSYVLIPQSPTVWMNVNGTPYELTPDSPTSMYTQTLMELIENYVSTHPGIDTKRIYIGGCSNGGYMTMNMILNYPDYFAAAYPVCQAYTDSFISDEQIEAIKDLPIWFTHASDDMTVAPATTTILTYNRLLEAGAKNVHFTYWKNVHDTSGNYMGADGKPYVYYGHFSWIYVFNNECTLDNDYTKGKTTDEKGSGQTLFEWLAEQSK